MIDRIRAATKRDVSRETFERLERFAEMIAEENQRQNIISPGGMVDLWTRHIVDGAQLLGIAGRSGSWCDIGSGPGLPGIVIAILGGLPMTLIEPRRLRADFLKRAVLDLGLADVAIKDCKVEKVAGKFDLITARAVASLDRLFSMAGHLTHEGTRWILPKGERAKSELDEARRNWQGRFELVPSQTHEGAAIVVADRISRRRGK